MKPILTPCWRNVSLNLFRRFSALPLLALLGGVFGQAQVQVQVQVQRVDSPQRVVALAPSLSEIVAKLLGRDLHRLVGVTEASDFPAELKNIQSVGPYHQFSLERVLALKPDLVLATADGNPKDQVLRLRELGIPVVVTQQKSLSEIESTVLLVARSLGLLGRGQEQVMELREGLKAVRKQFNRGVSPRVLLQLGDEPLIVAGSGSFLDDCLIQLGAKNVYAHSSVGYPHPSAEDVIVRNPDVIVILSFGDAPKRYEEMQKKWLSFKKLRAVQNARVLMLRSDELLRPTPRILEGLKKLGEAIFQNES